MSRAVSRVWGSLFSAANTLPGPQNKQQTSALKIKRLYSEKQHLLCAVNNQLGMGKMIGTHQTICKERCEMKNFGFKYATKKIDF